MSPGSAAPEIIVELDGIRMAFLTGGVMPIVGFVQTIQGKAGAIRCLNAAIKGKGFNISGTGIVNAQRVESHDHCRRTLQATVHDGRANRRPLQGHVKIIPIGHGHRIGRRSHLTDRRPLGVFAGACG